MRLPRVAAESELPGKICRTTFPYYHAKKNCVQVETKSHKLEGSTDADEGFNKSDSILRRSRT
jgi:hypothetical protein